ncbi:MAG: enoyl-CoA hydratase/isomerase family protein [Anaerolineae bacterium]|nr:enoyl-CoA hydratase/isomerase family protein [Anaerolineae bacterium]
MSLIVEKSAGVVTLTLNRPQVRNAVDAEIMIHLREEMELHSKAADTRVFVITGAEGAFSSGADIQAALQAGVTPLQAQQILTEAYAPAIRGIRNCPQPVIAAVDGMAAGIGCDLAMVCDLRLVSERGKFAELFIRVGLIPDGGGTYLLPRLVGVGRAFEMMVTGETVDAQEAYRIGLANKVFPTEMFYEQVKAYAEKLAAQAPLALMRGKKAMYAALEDSSLEQAMQREAGYQREIFESEDGFEGFRAFIEKRPPVWKGR